MLNNTEIEKAIDSMDVQMNKREKQLLTDLNRNFFFREDTTLNYDTITAYPFEHKSIIENFDTLLRRQILHHATDIAQNVKNYIHGGAMVLENQHKIQNKQKVEWHRKYTLSFACILLFFIGAPFGAIVKKGGLGLPVIISVFIFLSFHVLSIVGEKLAKSGSWEPYEGMWMAAVILSPLGLFLTYKATSDSAIFNAHAYRKFFSKLFKFARKQ